MLRIKIFYTILIVSILIIGGIYLYVKNTGSSALSVNNNENSHSHPFLGLGMNLTRNSFLYNILWEIIARLDITNNSLINQAANYINNNPDNTTTIQGFNDHKENVYGLTFVYIINETNYFYIMNSITFTNHGIFKIKNLKIEITKFGTASVNLAGYEWRNNSNSYVIAQMNTITTNFSQPPQIPEGGHVNQAGAGVWLGLEGYYNNSTYVVQTGYYWDNFTMQNKLFYEIYPSPAYYYISSGKIVTVTNNHNLFIEIWPSSYADGEQTWYFEIEDMNAFTTYVAAENINIPLSNYISNVQSMLETPLYCSNSSLCNYDQLPEFNYVQFNNVYAYTSAGSKIQLNGSNIYNAFYISQYPMNYNTKDYISNLTIYWINSYYDYNFVNG